MVGGSNRCLATCSITPSNTLTKVQRLPSASGQRQDRPTLVYTIKEPVSQPQTSHSCSVPMHVSPQQVPGVDPAWVYISPDLSLRLMVARCAWNPTLKRVVSRRVLPSCLICHFRNSPCTNRQVAARSFTCCKNW